MREGIGSRKLESVKAAEMTRVVWPILNVIPILLLLLLSVGIVRRVSCEWSHHRGNTRLYAWIDGETGFIVTHGGMGPIIPNNRLPMFHFERHWSDNGYAFLVKAQTLFLWMIAAMASCLPVWRFRRRIRTRRRLRNGQCPHCGYNLTGNTSGVCPECGGPVTKPESGTL